MDPGGGRRRDATSSGRRTAAPTAAWRGRSSTPTGERIYFVEDADASGPQSAEDRARLGEAGRHRQADAPRASRGPRRPTLSPDGRWVAFNEQYNAWVTALPPLGAQTVDIELGGAALPLAQLTDEGGEWVNWADGGKTLTWIWGPTYHRIALDHAWPRPPSRGAIRRRRRGQKDKDKDKEREGQETSPRRRSSPKASRSRSP